MSHLRSTSDPQIWKNMTEKQKAPYKKIALKNKEKYMQEMDMYKQRIEEECANLKKEEEVLMKLQKQEAMQLLKKKEKTETRTNRRSQLLHIFFSAKRRSRSFAIVVLCARRVIVRLCDEE